MKTATAELKAHLAGANLTISTLWKVTRTDGQVFGFTDNSRDVEYLGVTYQANAGHTPSAIKTTSTLSVDNLEVMSVLDSATITEADIQAGLWDAAEVEIMIVNYTDLSLNMGHMLLRKGHDWRDQDRPQPLYRRAARHDAAAAAGHRPRLCAHL